MNAVLTVFMLLCVACSASPRINVGNEPDGSVAGSGGAAGVGGGLGGFGGGDNTLTALITEPPSEMAIEVITISCAGECKQVLAVASGGNAPYTFVWNDGVTTAAREICADDDTTFTVTVNDTAIVDGEFPYAGQTVTASVTASVLTCPSDGGVDGGPSMDLCLDNPSFEGTPRISDFMPFEMPPWQQCHLTPDVIVAGDFHGTPDPTDGVSYLGCNEESASSVLCTPLRAGEVVHVLIDVAHANFGGPGGYWEIYGSTGQPCGEDTLLGQTVPTATANIWETQCLTLQPDQDIQALTLHARVAYALADNMRTVASCP